MLDRRRLLLGAGVMAAAGAMPGPVRAAIEPAMLGDNGLYSHSWFLQSFLDLAEDVDAAASAGKRFVIMWELKGCPYCRETHLVNLADPEIHDFVRDNFDVLQLDYIGSRMVTDFDGEELAERDLARKYGVRFTPTFQFFPDSSAGLGDMPAAKREVARAPGYLKPPHFLAMFRYVRENAYTDNTFRNYLKNIKK